MQDARDFRGRIILECGIAGVDRNYDLHNYTSLPTFATCCLRINSAFSRLLGFVVTGEPQYVQRMEPSFLGLCHVVLLHEPQYCFSIFDAEATSYSLKVIGGFFNFDAMYESTRRLVGQFVPSPICRGCWRSYFLLS